MYYVGFFLLPIWDVWSLGWNARVVLPLWEHLISFLIFINIFAMDYGILFILSINTQSRYFPHPLYIRAR
jgi:hypothetical protein